MWNNDVIGPKLFKANYALQNRVQSYAYVKNNPLTYVDPMGWDACCGRPFSDCWGDCIERWRLTSLLPLGASTFPKRWLPPFRVPYPEQPYTNILSSLGMAVGGRASAVGSAIRTVGRIANPVANAALVFEGFWDLTIITECAASCRMHPCGGGL